MRKISLGHSATVYTRKKIEYKLFLTKHSVSLFAASVASLRSKFPLPRAPQAIVSNGVRCNIDEIISIADNFKLEHRIIMRAGRSKCFGGTCFQK